MNNAISSHDKNKIVHSPNGEKISTILNYFYPELVTAFLLYSALSIFDSYILSQLSSTDPYTTQGYIKTLFHLITKIAEGFSVGMVVLCGQFNGAGEYKKVGQVVTDAFWATCIFGGFISLSIYFGAYWILTFLEVPQDIIQMGMPFLRLRALGIFLNFIYFALIGFLRGIKNTRAPMYFFLAGAIVFVFFDYGLVLGRCGLACMKIQGSALASVIQYSVMLVFALIYILKEQANHKFSIKIFRPVNLTGIKDLVLLSWPVMLDKAIFAIYQIWLAKMVGCMARDISGEVGKSVLASFVTLKDMQVLSLMPGVALAQVMTLLVSNDLRVHNWSGIKNNIKKISYLAFGLISAILIIFCIWSEFFIKILDRHGTFTEFAVKSVPLVSLLILLDVGQLILSAALRGAADVKMVMWVRVLVGVFFFFPASYFFANLKIENILIKFILVYGSFFFAAGIIGVIYLIHLNSNKWKHHALNDPHQKN